MEFNRKLTRRDFLKLGATGMAAATLAGCGGGAEEPAMEEPAGGEAPAEEPVEEAPAEEPVEINFLSWGDIVDVPVWGVL